MVTHPSSPDSLCNKSKLCRPSNQQKWYTISKKSAELQQNSAINKNFQIATLAIGYPSKLLSAISGAGAKSAATLALALHPQLTADKTPSFPGGDEDDNTGAEGAAAPTNDNDEDEDGDNYDHKGDGFRQQFNSK